MLSTRIGYSASQCGTARRRFARTAYSNQFYAKDVKVTLRQKPKKRVPKEELVFGKTTTDHMLSVKWSKEKGWRKPQIKPYKNLSLDPSAFVLHYGHACFEGMKAYKDAEGNIRLFRPEDNMARLHKSALALDFPSFPEDELLELVKQLLKLDADWFPEGDGYAIYIRPNIIGTTAGMDVSAARDLQLNVIMSPVGPYFKEGFKPIKLLADTDHVRAWPGGAAAHKIGAYVPSLNQNDDPRNYAPTIHAQSLAAKRGYNSILWLLNDKVTEAGTMNLFCLWRNHDNQVELITAPLDGCILPGVTRRSIIDLAKEWNEFEVTERDWTIHELVDAVKSDRVIELFGAGTAAVVCPVAGFEYKSTYYNIPCDLTKNNSLYQRLWGHMNGIYYGKIASPWSVVVG